MVECLLCCDDDGVRSLAPLAGSDPLARWLRSLAPLVYVSYTYVDMAAAEDGTWDVPAYRRDSRCLTPQTHRVETKYSRMARLAHVSNILRVQTHSNPLTVKTYFYITYSGS